MASATAATGWTEVAGSFAIPAGHQYARMYLTAAVSGTRVTSNVYADDASLRSA